MPAGRKTHRILQEIHQVRLDRQTRDHRAELEQALLRRHGELYGERQRQGAGSLATGHLGRGLRFAAAALALVIAALGAGAIPIDHEVPLGHEVVLEIPGASPAEIPPLPELLEACERLSGAASVSVNVAGRDGATTVTVLLLGDAAETESSPGTPSRADHLAEGLRELHPGLATATVSSRELIGVFPRSLGEVLGRKLFAVELAAGELAAARREILSALGDRAATVEVDAEAAGDRRTIRVRIEEEK